MELKGPHQGHHRAEVKESWDTYQGRPGKTKADLKGGRTPGPPGKTKAEQDWAGDTRAACVEDRQQSDDDL